MHTPPTPDREREAFEQFFSGDGQWPNSVERAGHGYKLQSAHAAWVAWQGAMRVDRKARKEAAETIERQDAELAALRAECERLTADLKKHKAHIRLTNDIITNQCIAMQSALIDQHHKGHEAGMVWIGNTLFGPGLIPDIGEALALSKTDPAQAWFDAKTAEHEAMRAKQDADAAITAQAQERTNG